MTGPPLSSYGGCGDDLAFLVMRPCCGLVGVFWEAVVVVVAAFGLGGVDGEGGCVPGCAVDEL